MTVQKAQRADTDLQNPAYSLRSFQTSGEMAMPRSSDTKIPIEFPYVTAAETVINGKSLSQSASISSASSLPLIVRKPAPPVPKKPAVLTQERPHEVETPAETVFMRLQGTHPNRLTKSKPAEPGLIPLPHRFTQTGQGVPSPQALSPVLSLRPPSNALAVTALMDDDEDHAASIPSLQPSRRR